MGDDISNPAGAAMRNCAVTVDATGDGIALVAVRERVTRERVIALGNCEA